MDEEQPADHPRVVRGLLNIAPALDHLFFLLFAAAVRTLSTHLGLDTWPYPRPPLARRVPPDDESPAADLGASRQVGGQLRCADEDILHDQRAEAEDVDGLVVWACGDDRLAGSDRHDLRGVDHFAHVIGCEAGAEHLEQLPLG